LGKPAGPKPQYLSGLLSLILLYPHEVAFLGNNKSTVSSKYIFLVGISSFLGAIIFTLLSETFTSRLNNLMLSFIFLFLIIIVNIGADILGTAVTAASHVPFNAKAAKRIPGAPQGLQLICNADKVANICNDVIGDITTTVSGALGISIVIQLLKLELPAGQFWLNIFFTALIAAIIVSGKAGGKKVALSNPNNVVFFAGKVLARLESLMGFGLLRKRRFKGKQKVGKV